MTQPNSIRFVSDFPFSDRQARLALRRENNSAPDPRAAALQLAEQGEDRGPQAKRAFHHRIVGKRIMRPEAITPMKEPPEKPRCPQGAEEGS